MNLELTKDELKKLLSLFPHFGHMEESHYPLSLKLLKALNEELDLSDSSRSEFCFLKFDWETAGNKVAMIKAVRSMTGWGLKESKDCVELNNWCLAAPSVKYVDWVLKQSSYPGLGQITMDLLSKAPAMNTGHIVGCSNTGVFKDYINILNPAPAEKEIARMNDLHAKCKSLGDIFIV